MNSNENIRKIALIGTSCVGKTTIFEYLRQHNGSLRMSFVEEASREYFTKNPDISLDDRFTAKTQGAIQDLVMQNEQAAVQMGGAEIILCDRSVLDAAAYTRGAGNARESRQLVERVRHWLSTYGAFLLLDPTGVPYVTDAIRREDESFRMRNHDAFVALFKEENIQYQLVGGTLGEKIQQVQEVVLFHSRTKTF